MNYDLYLADLVETRSTESTTGGVIFRRRFGRRGNERRGGPPSPSVGWAGARRDAHARLAALARKQIEHGDQP